MSGFAAFKSGVFTFTLNAPGRILVACVLHFARLGFNLVVELGARKTHAVAKHHGVTLNVYGIGRLGVGDIVTANEGTGAANLSVTTQNNLVIGRFHLVGRNKACTVFVDKLRGVTQGACGTKTHGVTGLRMSVACAGKRTSQAQHFECRQPLAGSLGKIRHEMNELGLSNSFRPL